MKRIIALVFSVFVFFSSLNAQETGLKTRTSKFLDQTYITESLDFALYEAWIKLDDALSFGNNLAIKTAQNDFLQELEKEKDLKTYKIANSIYGIQNQLQEMEKACNAQDEKELARLVTAFYISKGLLYQKSGTVFVQLIISMSIMLLIITLLLLFYQLTYAHRIEIEKILKATNNGQEEERRRLALELHDSVAQQMRYVSILAEKIKIPLVLMQAGLDSLVEPEGFDAFMKKVPQAKKFFYENSKHEIFNAGSQVRKQYFKDVLEQFDKMLEA